MEASTYRSSSSSSAAAAAFSTRPFFGGRPSLLSSSRNKRSKNKERLSVSFDGAVVDDDGGHDSSTIIQEQAIAAALLFRHHQRNGSLPDFIRSTSVVYPSPGNSKKQGGLPKSSSARRRSLSDLTITPQQLVNGHQELKIESLETNHFVLVHGGGFGAWCWYKTMTLLIETGFKVDVVDLTGSGVSSFDTNSITSLAHYVKPLTDIFDKLQDGKKVILVGHDFGGACISFVMELYPPKIAKAVFIAAAMLTNGQNTLDIFSKQMGSNDLMRQAQIFLYGNGRNKPPTAVDFDKTLLRDLFFNQCSTKDVALASVSMRPIPFKPVLEKLTLSDTNYGSVRRFYIKTQEDCAISMFLQEAMIKSDPPERVFQIKGSDHAPFFSRPQGLHRILVEIAQVPPKKTSSSTTTELRHLLENDTL
ncbi:methyl esterase 13, ARABIDOPSIS THALIANA METHYL ESTERASE 13 [Hibiscus trionum]|nr:methyl esterase 13, ARABIDOPSIS THALIANA METHYL ESTERASE 13 [Hibiscus trionum]